MGQVEFDVRAESIQTLRFQTEDGEDSHVLAIFFGLKEAQLCAEILSDHLPLPEGYVLAVRLESVDPIAMDNFIKETLT